LGDVLLHACYLEKLYRQGFQVMVSVVEAETNLPKINGGSIFSARSGKDTTNFSHGSIGPVWLGIT
jgi:hypothetical protein